MKRTIALILTAIFIWSLTACGAGDTNPDSAISEAASVSEASVSKPQEASGADSAAPVLNRLLGSEGNVYNIYVRDRKLLNLVREYDPDYEEAAETGSTKQRASEETRMTSSNSAAASNAAEPTSSDASEASGRTESELTEGTATTSEKTKSPDSGMADPSDNTGTSAEQNQEQIETGKIGDVSVKWHIVGGSEDEYERILDQALVNSDAASDERVDLFLVDGDSVAKYCDATVDVAKPLSQLGLNEADLGQQYVFTRTMGSDVNQVQRALTWEVPCGIFAYRRSAAKAVLGTDNPVQVQEAVKNWDEFQKTAASAAAADYHMLSGYADAYYVYLAQREEGWVNDEDQLTVDPKMASWVHTTKDFSDRGYIKGRSGYHSAEWLKDLRNDRQLFGAFLTAAEVKDDLIAEENLPASASPDSSQAVSETESSTEGDISASVISRSESTASDGSINEESGDWAVCRGPSAYCQGGDWICAAEDSDNPTLSRDLIRKLFCSENVMSRITRETGEMTNHMAAMKQICDDTGFVMTLFGGQNYIRVYDRASRSCDAGQRTVYDPGINEAFLDAFVPYFAGTADEGTALNQFYTEVVNTYPDLSY